jgi:acetaldehyde dehydrogenase (acetylating)
MAVGMDEERGDAGMMSRRCPPLPREALRFTKKKGVELALSEAHATERIETYLPNSRCFIHIGSLCWMCHRTGNALSVKCVVIGPGNIGRDLICKIRKSRLLDVGAVIDIHEGEGLKFARSLGYEVISEGVDAFRTPADCRIAFDCTSAPAHPHNYEVMKKYGITMIDLTPAAIGPFVVPCVNLGEHLDGDNVNLITCGGQATIPIVYAISRLTPVAYAEVVATIASESAGMGTRANIDEFTTTTRKGIELIGGANQGKAIIILNPAEPPITMRSTIYTLCPDLDAQQDKIRQSIHSIEREVQKYVPGYKVTIDPIFDECTTKWFGKTLRVETKIQVEGAGDYLPKYSGNLDIQNSAAVAIAERFADRWAAVLPDEGG